MGIVNKIYAVAYVAVSVLFLCCGVGLLYMAGSELWQTFNVDATVSLRERFDSILESIARLTVAIASFELGQTVLEEKVLRATNISAPTRVRRFLSRFLVVVVVSLAVECLVSTFHVAHMDPALLPQAAWSGFAAAALLVAWGIFVRQNRTVEELEPHGIVEAQREDDQVEQADDAGRERREPAAPPPRPAAKP